MYGSVKKGGMSCTKGGGKKMSVSHKKHTMRKRGGKKGGMSCTKHGGKKHGKKGGMNCNKGGKKGKTMKRRKSQKKSMSFLQRLGF
jgi:hypothetical protein